MRGPFRLPANPATVALLRHGGSHLIRPVIADLGFGIVEPGKDGAPLNRAFGKVVVFLRDPRDRMASTWRWRVERFPEGHQFAGMLKKPKHFAELERAAPGDMDRQIAWLLEGGGGFLREMAHWAKIWCRWPDALKIRFEDFAEREHGIAQVSDIAGHLGLEPDLPRDCAIYQFHYANSRTYTGELSRWEDYFGPASTAAWERSGGPQLLRLMGYE